MRSYGKMLSLINGTTTQTGLTVNSVLVKKKYEKGKKISDKEMENLELEKHSTCSKWNYTIRPKRLLNIKSGFT